jgi:hypothetical protein
MKPAYANRQGLRARFLARLKGRPVYCWPVSWSVGERTAITQDHDDMARGKTTVISHTAREAASFVAQPKFLGHYACVEISVWGPKSGLAAKRFWGWERAIWNQLCNLNLNRKQLMLPL